MAEQGRHEMQDIMIGADGIDAEAIVKEIRARAEKHRNSGAYDMDAMARAERFNIVNIQDDDDLFDRYILCLRLLAQVDISDWKITEKRAKFAPLLVKIKKSIWSLLKFYTYHLWSQQNQVNALLNNTLSLVINKTREDRKAYEARIAELEKRIEALEAGK